MVRALVSLLPLALASSGCSLLLDFSDGAVPVDAEIDGPFSQAECDYKEPNENAGAPAVFDVTETGPVVAAGGTRKVKRVAEADVMVAARPFSVTAFAPGVAPNEVPVTVTLVPTGP